MRWLVLVGLMGCGAANSTPVCPRSFGSERSAPPAPSAGGPVKAEPGFAVSFEPDVKGGALNVRIRTAARNGLERWAAVTHRQPDAVNARDETGAIPTSWKDAVLELGRAPKGFLELSYSLPARPEGEVVAAPSGYVRFYGEPLLVPVALANEKMHVSIDFDFAKTPFENAASSFGIGKHVEADLAPVELTKGAYIAGDVFSARFATFEGKDDFAWIGYAAFDPRWISAEIATLRTSVSQYFGDGHPPPFTMLLTVDKRGPIESTPISIYPRWRGVFAIADVDAPWGIGARMSMALALVSRFIGGRITGEVAVVSGVARYAAREILLASGTMTPLEYADEINGEIAATLFADKSPQAAQVARVSLWASSIDRKMRKSGGKQSMRTMLHDWAASAHVVQQGDVTDTGVNLAALPDDTFGKCFTRGPTRFDELDLGFDEQKTRAEKKLVGVAGAAKKAGLREGEPLVSIRYDEGQAEHPVRVVVLRDGKNVEVKYRPIGRSKTAQGFRVVPGIDPSTCSR